MLACCQGLQSSNVEVAKTKIAFSPVLVAIQLFAIGNLILPEAPKSILPGTEYNTGPPLPGSLVGTVLKRAFSFIQLQAGCGLTAATRCC